MARRRARRSPIPKLGREGGFNGWPGELRTDAISGWEWPEGLMLKQCGGWRRRGPHHGTHDLCDPTDDCCPAKPGKVLVSVVATDDVMCEEDQSTGVFTITRTGSTVLPLQVYFGLTGTATIVADYTASATSPVTIPAGSATVTVTLTPVNDGGLEGSETAILSVVPSIYGGYDVDLSAYQATVVCEEVELVAIAWLLRYEFTSGSLLVNSGDAGASYNLSETEQCVEEG